jgi:hypothetical protein
MLTKFSVWNPGHSWPGGCQLTGQTFGLLTVLSLSLTKHQKRGRWWHCKCAGKPENMCLGFCELPGLVP